MTLYNTSFIITEIKDDTKIRLFAENEYYNKIQIAFFDFYYNEGWIMDLKGNKKDVKRHATIMNYLFKQNTTLGWDSGMVEQAKKNAKQIKLDETKQYNTELKEASENKALDMINGIKNREEKYTNICKGVENKTDEELLSLVINTFKHASKKTINEVLNIIKSYNDGSIVYVQEETTQDIISPSNDVTEVVENTTNNEKEVFYLYNKTFNTYMDAYNHAIQSHSKTTMVLSSKHSYMTNERLHQLEYSYTFDKIQMLLEDKKEYFKYISELPVSLDRDNRYYKLKSWIEREEVRIQREKEEKERVYNINKEAYETLEYMKSKGLEVVENESMVKWYLNNKEVHTWFSGINADKYHEAVMQVYNQYFR